MSKTSRLTYLDLLRGLAAIAVLIVHYRFFFTWPGGFSDEDNLPWDVVLGPLYTQGGTAVQLFWLLSGSIFFLMYGNDRIDLKSFAIRRFARLYPLHFATLLIIAGLQIYNLQTIGRWQVYENNDVYHFVLQLFMASNWGFEEGGSFNAPIWSISVEIIAYAVFAIFVKYLNSNLFWTSLIAILTGIAAYMLQHPVLTCISLFFLGGAIVRFRQFAAKFEMLDWVDRAARLICPPFILAVFLYFGRVPNGILFYFVFPAAIAWALSMDFNRSPLSAKWTWIGDISYSTYLLHMPILIAIKNWTDYRADRFEILASPLTLISYVAIVIAASALSYRFFERPMQRIIRQKYDKGSIADPSFEGSKPQRQAV